MVCDSIYVKIFKSGNARLTHTLPDFLAHATALLCSQVYQALPVSKMDICQGF